VGSGEKNQEKGSQGEDVPGEEKSGDGSPKISPQAIIDLWNEVNPLYQKVPVALTSNRAEKLRARIKENPDLAYWRRIFENIRDIPFLRGEGPRGWKATLDYVIRNDTKGREIYEREPEGHSHGAAYYRQFTKDFDL
jgi:hypothetical protein